MLNTEEEKRLLELIRKIQICKKEGVYPRLTAYDIEWLVETLKKCNEVNWQLMDELQKTNDELTRFREHYEG